MDGSICWFAIIQPEITFRWILDGFGWAGISQEDEGHHFAVQDFYIEWDVSSAILLIAVALNAINTRMCWCSLFKYSILMNCHLLLSSGEVVHFEQSVAFVLTVPSLKWRSRCCWKFYTLLKLFIIKAAFQEPKAVMCTLEIQLAWLKIKPFGIDAASRLNYALRGKRFLSYA